VTVNVPLLRKTLEHIEAHPEEWFQGVWSCGTAGCFAWHAAMLDGAEPIKGFPSYVPADSDDPSDDVYPASDDHPACVHVAPRAARVLGIGSEAHPLFRASNSLDDLRRIVGRLTTKEETL
jgi:hypothetical protein